MFYFVLTITYLLLYLARTPFALTATWNAQLGAIEFVRRPTTVFGLFFDFFVAEIPHLLVRFSSLHLFRHWLVGPEIEGTICRVKILV